MPSKLLLVLVVLVAVAAATQTCSKQSAGDEECQKNEASLDEHSTETPAQKYLRASNEHWSPLQQLHDARKTFTPCAANCSCHYRQIKMDLKPFRMGITKDMVEEARSRGTLYQVLDGLVYREEKCMFPSRCAGVEHFLLELADKLPNCEFVVNVRDWPQVTAGRGVSAPQPLLPVFSFSKQEGINHDVLYPAWSFWEGGPAITLHPTGLGRWDIRRKTINKAGNKYKWSKKIEKGFFRGSRTTSDRDGLVLLSRDEPALVDAQYTKNQAWRSDKDTLNAPPAAEVSLENHCQYKYLFNLHGVAASFRFKHLFLCGSLVFHEMDGWIEFFYPQMKPWIHYIPLPSRPSKEEIKELLLFARDNDAIVRDIARKGRDFIASHLRMADVNCYWKKLLKTYAKLVTYEPVRRDDVSLVIKKKT